MFLLKDLPVGQQFRKESSAIIYTKKGYPDPRTNHCYCSYISASSGFPLRGNRIHFDLLDASLRIIPVEQQVKRW